ncbi:DUF4262 domain-containing protein [Actinomycetospora sp. NBRC 106378]|uniref:DUF4262 domain-containing protein n=1 Tax=Actinomycetospora sp. NBRC 106378 TaxID=3032208 RepID=UPI0025559AFD|nr:DUF4262 domain-containing protein [Actinomycetospora sp. NBRC 106378]
MMDLVERYGWAIQFVEGEKVRAQWAYTVGLARHGLPEFVVTGLRPERAGVLLNDTAHGVLCHEERWDPGQRFRVSDRMRIEVVKVSRPDAHLGTAVALFPDQPLQALQLVWCDGRGR